MSERTPGIPLQHEWVFYYDETQGKGLGKTQYENKLKTLGTFATVQEFWRYWNNINISSFPNNANLRLFKKGIMPTWEDPANAKGGRWIVEIPPQKSTHDWMQQTTHAWMLTLLAMIGEQFQDPHEVCGAVLSIRGRGNTVSLWHRTARNREIVARLEEDLKRNLKLSKLMELRYQEHNASVDWNKSVLKTRQQQELVTSSIQKEKEPPEDDDFQSPFHDLNAELKAKEMKAKSANEVKVNNTPAPAAATDGMPTLVKSSGNPPLKTHRKTLSLPSISLPSNREPGSGAPSSRSIDNMRRIRRRGKRSSSGSHRLPIEPILEENEEDTETSSEYQPSSAVSPSEKKYLQRKRSVDRGTRHRRSHSASAAPEDSGGLRARLTNSSQPTLNGTANGTVKPLRRSFSRSSSRENLLAEESETTSNDGNSFLASALVIILCAIIFSAYWMQYSCEHWEVNCQD